MHPHLARGSHDRLAQDLERPELLEREGEIDFFAGEVLLVEPADRFERVAPRKNERARAEPNNAEVNGAKTADKNARPETADGCPSPGARFPRNNPRRALPVPTSHDSALICVSASTKKRTSPRATRAPALRTAAICRRFTGTTRAPNCCAMAAVASVEASSTTMIS